MFSKAITTKVTTATAFTCTHTKTLEITVRSLLSTHSKHHLKTKAALETLKVTTFSAVWDCFEICVFLRLLASMFIISEAYAFTDVQQ